MDLPVILIAGFKNSGKTTLIENFIRDLKNNGFKIAVFKHVYYMDFEVDKEGKDTWRYLNSGADGVVAISRGRLYINEKLGRYPNIKYLIKDFLKKYDLIFIEGFKGLLGKDKDIHKIIVARDIGEYKSIVKEISEPILGYIIDIFKSPLHEREDYNSLLNKIIELLR